MHDKKNDNEDVKNELNKYIVFVQKSSFNEDNKKEIYSLYSGKKNKDKNIEKFGTYSTFVLSLASLIISTFVLIYYLFSFYKTEVEDKIENIVISNVYETDYFFDGENLSKDISMVISNNSEVNVSIININIKREFVNYSFDAIEDIDLPINMVANSSTTKVVTIYFNIDDSTKRFIMKKYGYNCEIDTYELDSYLEYNEDIINENNIVIRPSIDVGIITSKGKIIRYERNSGATVTVHF